MKRCADQENSTVKVVAPIEPILRWAGSKRRVVPQLKEYWSERFHRYMEPFAGSACLFFAIQPKNALLSDINPDLIDLYAEVTRSPADVYAHLTGMPRGSDAYYKVRSMPIESLSQAQRAARFMYLNRFCFNGLYRTNSAGKFNVPFAPNKTGDLPTWTQFERAAKLLSQATVLCSDFEEVIWRNVKRGDFIYLDPPYAVEARRVFRQYDPSSFNSLDLHRLNETLFEIDRRDAHFVLSYAECREAKECFRHWSGKRILVQRNIAGFAQHRRKAAEMLFSNIPMPNVQ